MRCIDDYITSEDAKLNAQIRSKVIESDPLNTVPKKERRSTVKVMKSSVRSVLRRIIYDIVKLHAFINVT